MVLFLLTRHRFAATIIYLFATLGTLFLMPIRSAVAQNPDPAEMLKSIFERVGNGMGDMLPGMFTELNEEQLKKLESVTITPREESAFGAGVLKEFESGLQAKNQQLLRNGKDAAYLQSLAERIKPFMANRRRYPRLDIAVWETTLIDAYSIPGGHIIVTTGLLADCESEAALVGVLAHELSHLDHGHQLLSLKQQKSIGKTQDFQNGMLWIATLAKPMRPEFESEADEDAARWSMSAGYDPRQLAHLLERWEVRLSGAQPWTNAIPEFARTHPQAGRRAARVLEIYDSEKPNKELIVGVENLRQRKR
ncbi:MAG: M48 family metallopeptidase [Pirellulales bacterium]